MRGTGVTLILALVLLTACCPLTQVPMPTSATPSSTFSSATPTTTTLEEAFAELRERMVVETIERRGITDAEVLKAMRSVPRHLFVPEEDQGYAYGDHPLPIGYGQTISQPYIVALMTELLELKDGDRVLEVGTGSGYQAAILGEIPGIEVYTIEIVPELAESARERLESLDYSQIHCRVEDPYHPEPS